MGVEQSKVNSEETRYGFHVLRVDANSPAAQSKLIPYFDYIVTVNGVEVLQEIPNVVAEMAQNHVDRPMRMAVYNSRQDTIREVSIVPSRNWGGKTLLGASIRFCTVSGAPDRVWHVMEVHPNSPAQRSGLISMKDWIIGSSEMALNSVDDFYNLMIHNQKRPVRLLVFNLEQEAVREVIVEPDFEWGGDGCLGCDVASGALHRIPLPDQTSRNIGPQPVLSPETTISNNDDRFSKTTLDVVSESTQVPSSVAILQPDVTASMRPIPGFDNDNSDQAFSLQ